MVGDSCSLHRNLLLASRRHVPILAARQLHGEPDMLEQDFHAISRQVDALLKQLRELHSENQLLKQQQTSLFAERDELQRKNELARARVEAIILRLRALEAQS